MLKNFKIGTRLGLGFGAILVLLMVVGGDAIMEIRSLHRQIDLLVTDRMVKTEQANSVIDDLNVIAQALRNIYIDTNRERQGEELRRIADARQRIATQVDEFSRTITSERGVALLRAVTAVRPEYIRHTEAYMDLIRTEQLEPARALLLSEIREVQGAYINGINELIEYQTYLANRDGQQAGQDASRATTVIGILLLVALVLSIGLAFLIIRSITGPVGKASVLAETMAKGDFTAKLDINQKDEIGLMATSLNTMVTQLSTMIRDIISGVDRLAASSNDMAAVSKQLSTAAKDTADRSSAVAAATEEMSTNFQSVSAAMEQSSSNVNMVASSTEEMTVTVNEIAQSAEKARSISENAVKQSQQTSEKMTHLGESARKIGRVTETITEISEQTNLLALNATIEAARAGEAGKGFAVVANEIKELARQTAEATVDIKNQISEMQATTTTTVEDIEKISAVINEINSVINGIATAVEEQSAASNEIANNISQASQGIAEVNENVAQSTVVVAEITRDINGINEQSGQVGDGSAQVQQNAQGLAELATQLDNLVKQFKV
ncbi:methyl-accepting chemotaxis protein [Desulfobulbus alkaliphilus]|uniref:methyl-accepting chemotaxis protein n=1 Tax=Desulfobulbus alkaliphilus TaxID=869814 RepID=UPI0019636F6A|nr:methyl-accepting chemotaxis protein [Desulfobulbus alkaliphilus]MBM9536087.1 methyl-accepting chemotaxis protein [Desulfobulbus alkaliphilus]